MLQKSIVYESNLVIRRRLLSAYITFDGWSMCRQTDRRRQDVKGMGGMALPFGDGDGECQSGIWDASSRSQKQAMV